MKLPSIWSVRSRSYRGYDFIQWSLGDEAVKRISLSLYIPNQDVMRFVTTKLRDKTVVVATVIGSSSSKDWPVMHPRVRKSWCLHKILISDTSQSGIKQRRTRGSWSQWWPPLEANDRSATLSISILFCLCWLFPRRVALSLSPSSTMRRRSSTNSNNANWHVTPLSQQRQTLGQGGQRAKGGNTLRENLVYKPNARPTTRFLVARHFFADLTASVILDKQSIRAGTLLFPFCSDTYSEKATLLFDIIYIRFEIVNWEIQSNFIVWNSYQNLCSTSSLLIKDLLRSLIYA